MALAPLKPRAPALLGACIECGEPVRVDDGSRLRDGTVIHVPRRSCVDGGLNGGIEEMPLPKRDGLVALPPRKVIVRCSGVAETCPIDECSTCAERDCPYGEPLHYHHDGCPRCALEEAAPKAREAAKRGGKSKGNDLYCTPVDFLDDYVRKFGTIALDPCGSAKHDNVQALNTYLIEQGQDGLALPWDRSHLGLTFFNNPYSQSRRWLAKADHESAKNQNLDIIGLVASRTGSQAWQTMKARLVCFVGERLYFIDPETGDPPKDAKGKPCSAMFDSAVLYWGSEPEVFDRIFSPLGKVVQWNED